MSQEKHLKTAYGDQNNQSLSWSLIKPVLIPFVILVVNVKKIAYT